MIFWPLHCKHVKPKTTREWVEKTLRKIMATQTEIVAQLKAAVDTINKIGAETDKSLLLIKDLQDAVANQSSASPELVAATDALVAQLKVVDDKVPDAVTPPPTA